MIVVIFGPAGAGKTSIARRLMEALDDAYLISSDGFKRRVYDRMMREVEKRIGRQAYLVLDGTFYKKEWRERLMGIASDMERVVTVFVDCPLETCLKRNREREKPIPEKAVSIIWRRFERPDEPDVHINTENTGTEEAVETILKELDKYTIAPCSTT